MQEITMRQISSQAAVRRELTGLGSGDSAHAQRNVFSEALPSCAEAGNAANKPYSDEAKQAGSNSEISVRITEVSVSGRRRSFSAGSSESRSLVINLLSGQGVVGCLALQLDDSGRPFIKLQREKGFEIRISSFAQMKLFQFKEVDTCRRGQ